MEARNVEIKSRASTLFVRFYLSVGHNRKVECQGNEAAVDELKQQRAVFELRRKKKASLLRKSLRSEIALKVQALEMEKMLIINKKEKRLEKLCVCCSSRDCGSCNCLDYEAFALACALDCTRILPSAMQGD
ncbi:unnamed protein product, partial [Thlaspi arvense]